MNLIELLNWRYATKSMNGNKVPSEKLENILEAIRLSASSAGLQPYKVIVISDPELKNEIRKIAYDQSQITDSSELLIFAGWDKVTPERIDAFIQNIADTRNVSLESLEGMKSMVSANSNLSPEATIAWTGKQSYIGLGTALIAAADEGVDATPMEGFVNDQLDALLDLPSMGLKSTAILAWGYRNEENDWLVNLPKVRTPKEEFIIRK